MVWYNITAYNIKVKFVLRNNKEKVICNNKNDEGEMQMKCKRNLERAIVLGLILSTGVCGSAWAEYTSIDDSGKWIGIMDRNGQGASISTDKTFDSINVNATGVPANYNNSSKTTTALLVNSGNTVTVNGAVSIINNATHEDIENNNALYVANESRVTINGGNDNVFICAINGNGNRDAAITAKRAGHVSITGNNVQIIGSVDFIGDGSTTKNTTDIKLNSKNSFWYGNELQALSEEQFNIYKSNPFIYAIMQAAGINNYEDVINKIGGGNLNLELNNGAEWVYDSSGSNFMFVPDYSFNLPIQSEPTNISAITLNGGVVNLQDDDIKANYADYIGDLSKYKEHHKVTIGELKGTGGIFKVDLDWETNKGNDGMGQKVETENSDYIYIKKVEGTDSKQIVDFDASKAHLENMEINKDKLYFANVADGNTSFTTLSSVYSNASNVFDYTYGTGSDNGKDWYIAVSGKSAESNPNFSAAKGAMYAGYALGTELDTLNKRMGEARYLEEDDGVWVRYRHSKTGWDDTYETNGDMFQLGFDNEVTEKDGKHYRGVAIDYTDADTNIMGISGEGEHERYAVSLYDTWLGEKGHYRDLVLRGGRINSDYDISGAFSSGYEDIGGDYHQWFGSISAEWGRKNDMGTGWYFEPQVQAQLARVGGASYVSDSGIDVDQDGATSLIGRAGFRIGREYVKDNGKHDNFYIKADLLHEFAGDKSFSLTGNDGRYDKEYDGQETWCDVGIGADISLGKNSYFWADVERTFGADFDNTWQINGGFRWEF